MYAILKLNEKLKKLPATVTLSEAKGLTTIADQASGHSEILRSAQNDKRESMEILTTRQPFSTEKTAMKWDGEWHIIPFSLVGILPARCGSVR